MNGKHLAQGDTLSVTRYEPPEKKPVKISPVSGNPVCVHSTFNNLYVKNFPQPNFEDGELHELFSKYGEISSAIIMRDENGNSKGFGFVCFKEHEAAKAALAENSEIPGGLYVREALSKEQRQSEIERRNISFKKSMQFLSLHVRGFDAATTSIEDMRQYFAQFGEVRSTKVTNTGAILISFSDRESARNALEQTNGSSFNGTNLTVAYFEPREMRTIHKQEQLDKKASEDKRNRDLFATPIDANITSILTTVAALLSINNFGGGGGNSYPRYNNNSGYQNPRSGGGY